MCGGGPKGPSAAEQQAQAEANAALIRAETDKIKAEQEIEKQKQADKVMADNKAMAQADQQKKQRQLTLLGGILGEDEDETPLDSTLTDRKKSKKKPLLQQLGE
jgi:regulator of protease activity HflC (stomatin/prohibitin superfamily)